MWGFLVQKLRKEVKIMKRKCQKCDKVTEHEPKFVGQRKVTLKRFTPKAELIIAWECKVCEE